MSCVTQLYMFMDVSRLTTVSSIISHKRRTSEGLQQLSGCAINKIFEELNSWLATCSCFLLNCTLNPEYQNVTKQLSCMYVDGEVW